jgi:hypothetical protein
MRDSLTTFFAPDGERRHRERRGYAFACDEGEIVENGVE